MSTASYRITDPTQQEVTDGKPKFYADSETLKNESGYYSFMNALPVDPKQWIENCHPCQKPMRKIMVQNGTRLEAIIGSEVGLVQGAPLSAVHQMVIQDNSRINPHQPFWFCPSCQSVWSSQLGFWIKIRINGEEQLVMSRILDTEARLQNMAVIASNALPDPGIKPSPDSTICPHCHVYRVVKPWEPVVGEDTGKDIHTCPKCITGDIVERPSKIQEA